MTTYHIRPNSKGFGVYKGRNWLGRPKLIEQHDRLFNAELHALNLVTQDYHKLLDYRRLTNQIMSTDMLEPRANEEHIYTALLLAGKRPVGGDGTFDEISGFSPRATPKSVHEEAFKYDNILEAHLGKPISHIARVMFEERFMTWYGNHHPEWTDPRRERDYDVARDQLGANRYRNQIIVESEARRRDPGFMKRWMAEFNKRRAQIFQSIFGPSAKQMTEAAQAMSGETAGSSR